MTEKQQPASERAGLEKSHPAHLATNFTVRPVEDEDTTLLDRIVERVAPWGDRRDRNPYPGRMRTLVASLLHRVGYDAIRKWRKGKNRFPAWAARQWAAVLTARAEADLALARELTEHAEREEANPRKVYGCCAVKDRGGVVRDGRGGYRAKIADIEAG